MVSPRRHLTAFFAILLLGYPAGLASARSRHPVLPHHAPVPHLLDKPVDMPSDAVPLPEQTPENPGAIPLPQEKPTEANTDSESVQPTEAEKKPEKKSIPPDPRATAMPINPMPAEEVACRARLKAMGVEFEEHAAERDPQIGCSIPYPIVLKTLGNGIDLEPKAELNCAMAEAAARFMSATVAPAVNTRFKADVKSVNQASAFVCRPRHNGQKISEHAFGNALDIASFTLSDGARIDIEPVPPEEHAKFLSEIRKAACGPFKTVLGPGSDPDHSLHFHVDLEPRRNGGTFCQ